MKKAYRILTLILAICMLGGMLIGCNTQGSTSQAAESSTAGGTTTAQSNANSDVVIGVSLPSKELARCLKDQEYLTANLKDAGYSLDVQFAQGDANIQISQVENMITNGVDALIISPWDGSSMTKIAELAHENDIPVVSYDALILNSEFVEYYIADDLREIGATQARYIVEKLELEAGKGPFNLEIVAGDPADSNAPYFYNGAMDVLKPYIDKGSLVVQSGQKTFAETGTPGWDPMKAQSRMDAIVSTFYTDKHLDAVLCSNDGVAIGTISSLKSAGYGTSGTPLPITTGQDCDIASIKSIIAGEQSMTVFKDIRVLAKNASYVIDCLIKGVEPDMSKGTTFNNGVKDVPTLVVQPKALDAENYKELLLDSGYYNADQLK